MELPQYYVRKFNFITACSFAVDIWTSLDICMSWCPDQCRSVTTSIVVQVYMLWVFCNTGYITNWLTPAVNILPSQTKKVYFLDKMYLWYSLLATKYICNKYGVYE